MYLIIILQCASTCPRAIAERFGAYHSGVNLGQPITTTDLSANITTLGCECQLFGQFYFPGDLYMYKRDGPVEF